MKSLISPSMISASYANLPETLKLFEKHGIDYLHIDVMDGEFVPNIALGTNYISALKKMCNIPLDIHLMVTRPDNKLSYFEFGPKDIVSVHYESTPHIHRTLCAIKDRGAKAFVVLCPGTPVSVVENLADTIDGILIMTVNPGFSGQKLIESCLEKIKEARKLLTDKLRDETIIEVDGNVGFENAVQMKALGANMFVGGSASIFYKNDLLENNIVHMQEVLK